MEALRRNGVHGLIDLYKEEDGERYVVEYPPWAEEATLRADPEALVACQALELMGRTISVALEEFPVPVMLTTGELEDPEDVAARHAARVPRGDSVRVPDAGHGAGCAASEVLVPPVTAFLHRWF